MNGWVAIEGRGCTSAPGFLGVVAAGSAGVSTGEITETPGDECRTEADCLPGPPARTTRGP